MTGGQHNTRREHELAGADVLACVAHRCAGLDRATHVHRGAIGAELRELDHDRRVRTVGHRCAGHDAQRLARADWVRERRSGGERADDPKGDRRRGDVGGAHREAVDRGVRERRDRLGRHDLLGQHQAQSRAQRDDRRGAHPAPSQHVLASIFQADHRPRLPTGGEITVPASAARCRGGAG